ncbi:ThiF family adenylyltransferase [Microbacterium halophytorum]|uniref:ThiF family adenylyltransferase n=1 Tax=Microbacterium halophytorum TaxID=2067568 RepID=UPI000CFAAD40|nr:ThiF family adenylyltransferase [Microbacterium halophytorum]
MAFPPLVEPAADLSDLERARTARHLALAGFGEDAQRRLKNSHVALIGAGGLGSPALLALAAAGVGTITVVDDDAVEASNLQRQVMHRMSDVGEPKAASAVRAAADLSPETRVVPVIRRLDASNAASILAGADVVLDGADTFETRLDVAAACERLGIPLVWGVIQEFSAQLTVFWSSPPVGSPVVLGDLYPRGSAGVVPTCAQVGVLGAMCLQIGSAMAMQAILLIAGIGEPLLGRLQIFDALGSRWREVPLVGAAGPQPSAPAQAHRERTPIVSVDDLSDFLTTPLDGGEPDAPAFGALLDVREAAEVAEYDPFPGAVHLPLDEVLADPAAAAARVGGGRVAVVCRAGVRSAVASEALRRVGADARTVAGGVLAWAEREGAGA